MLAFLHTSAFHVPTFTRLVRELAADVPVRHALREDLLARALADGEVTEATGRATRAAVEDLVAAGARVVVCTCSTLGSAAEASRTHGARVLRVDRPLVERAVALGRPVLLVATTPTAMTSALALFEEVGAHPPRQLSCDAAWRSFETGDQTGYAAAIAAEVQKRARPRDVVVLAQASMAPAASLLHLPDVEILASPELAVRAAQALL